MKMETVILKVNVNCHGCHQKVKKILKKIEGVIAVNIDAEQQRVIVKGIVDSAKLIKKLARSGKHAELWSSKSQQPDLNPQLFSPGKTKNKNPIQPQNNSRGAVSLDQLTYPNLHDGGSFGSELGFEEHVDQDTGMELEPEDRASLYMGSTGNRINGEGNYEKDIGAMISMMGIHGNHDDDHRHWDGSFGSGRSQFQRFQNYPAASGGYGYQQQPSPLMVENILASQYNQNPYVGWLRTNPQMHAFLDNNNYRMHDGYMHMYHQY